MKKLGLIHYNAPGATLVEFLTWASEHGFEYAELMPPDVAVDDVSDEEALTQARSVRKLADSLGIRVSAFSARNDFLQTDPSAVAFQVERLKKVARVAQILSDEPILRCEGGWEKESVPPAKWGDALYEVFARCIDFVTEMDVQLAIDNHGKVTNQGDLLIDLLKRLNCCRIGSNLDTMNFRWLGNDLETCNRFYATLAPFVKHVHLKDGEGSLGNYHGQALGEGEIDLEYAISCLKGAGYDGAYAAEYEGPETADGVGYIKNLVWMKAHI